MTSNDNDVENGLLPTQLIPIKMCYRFTDLYKISTEGHTPVSCNTTAIKHTLSNLLPVFLFLTQQFY